MNELPPLPDGFEAVYLTAVRDSAPGTMKDIARLCWLAAIEAHEARKVPDVRKEALMDVIRRLNGNPYSLTKYECIDEIEKMLASAPPAPQAEPDRTGVTYYKNDDCKAPSAEHPDCICWTPAPQASGYGPKLMPQVSGFEQASVVKQEAVHQWRFHGCGWKDGHPMSMEKDNGGVETRVLYTHPAQQAKPLTPEQREAVFTAANALQERGSPTSWEHAIVDAVEAALGITKE